MSFPRPRLASWTASRHSRVSHEMRSWAVAQWRGSSPDVLQDAQELLVGLLPEHLAQHDLVQRAAPPRWRLEGEAAIQECALHAVGPLGDRRQPAGSALWSGHKLPVHCLDCCLGIWRNMSSHTAGCGCSHWHLGGESKIPRKLLTCRSHQPCQAGCAVHKSPAAIKLALGSLNWHHS